MKRYDNCFTARCDNVFAPCQQNSSCQTDTGTCDCPEFFGGVFCEILLVIRGTHNFRCRLSEIF